MRLGKMEYQHDERTLPMSLAIDPQVFYPQHYDFDLKRAPLPIRPWGNTAWGNCVKAGEANHMLRLERVEQRRTLPLTEELVVQAYQDECERQFGKRPQIPGDENDNGLFVLKNISNWRNVGWEVPYLKSDPNKKRLYKIAAYGELDPANGVQLRQAIYLLRGIQLGFWLPRAVQGNMAVWDYHGENSPEWQPGSWGGHLVYAKAYEPNALEILTWGEKVWVTDAFIRKYCDEAWAVVDNLDSWRYTSGIDVEAMLRHLREIGARNVE